MKKSILLLFGLSLQTFILFAQKEYLNNLVYSKQFTELDRFLKTNMLPQKEYDIYNALLLNAFNKPGESNKILSGILTGNNRSVKDSLHFYLLSAQNDNYVKLFDYANAYKTDSNLVFNYKEYFSNDALEEEEQSLKIYKPLSTSPAQTLRKNADTKLALTTDMAGLKTIPVTVSDSTYNFIFDTGAGMSVVSDSFAKKLHLQMVPNSESSVKSGATGIRVNSRLGIAPVLTIGNMQFSNIIFLIFSDSDLSFAGGRYKINGIIGFPVIKEFGEFSISDGYITIPQTINAVDSVPNMIVDGLKPVIYMNYKGKDLPFTFDTGDDDATLNNNFYALDSITFNKNADKKEVSFGGAGGDKKAQMIIVPGITLMIGNTTAVFKNQAISLTEIPTDGKIYYGNIGQSLIKQFKKMTISFKNSFIHFD